MWYDNEISMGIMQRKYLHPGEKPEDFIPRIVSIFSDFLQDEARNVLENADFLPAGRTLFGAGFKGKRKVSLSNCFVLPSPDDNIESIFDTSKMIARISSYGGGCGLAIDNLRPKGAPVNNSAITSSGAVSFLNVFDVTGSTIGQNGRRAALMVGLRCDHPDIEEFLKIKQDGDKLPSMNISIKFTDEFMNAVKNNEDYELHFESPETGRISRKINAAQFFKNFCECAHEWAEPGCIYIDRVQQYQLLSGYPDYRIEISNPCLAGYTRILTDQGYFPIESLANQEVNIWNGYRYSKVIPRITGHDQKMVRVEFSNGAHIDCTLYHKFVMADGTRKEAKDLQPEDALYEWNYIPIEGPNNVDRKIMYTHGFFSGDGTFANDHPAILLYGPKKELLEVINYSNLNEQTCLNTSGGTRFNARLIEDGIIPFDKNWVPDASFSIDSRLWWLAGLIDSDGTKNSQENTIAISSINYEFLHNVQLMLNTLGISSKIRLMRKGGIKLMPANNGTGEYKEYYCQDCYRLLLSSYSVLCLSRLGLRLFRVPLLPITTHPKYNQYRYIRVVSITQIPNAPVVYCLNEPYNHTLIAEGILTGNCAEFFGAGGNSCNLGSLNVYNFIDEKFTPNAHINYDKLKYATHVAVRMLDEILDYGYDMQPLDLNRESIRDWRSIGLGVFGFADALVAMGIKYGSKESRGLVSDFMEAIMKQSIITSCELAEQKGTFAKYNLENTLKSPIIQMFPELHDLIRKCGMRNGSLISIAPTGTISLFAGGFTGGVEPMYKIAYERASHQMEEQGRSFFIYARGVKDLLEYNGCSNITPEEAKKRYPFLVESHDVPYMDRVYFQAAMQDYVDNAISSTVNLPHDATVEDVYNVYMTAWEQGLKGITIFRDGCKRANILGIDSNKKEETKSNNDQPDFDTIDPPSRRLVKVINGATARESTSCVKSMYVTVNKTPEDKVFEIFTNASGGCKANINTISRLCSLALRGGIKVSRVIDELRANQCPACQVLRRQGKDVSLSCANAIADAMEEIIGEQMVEQESAINKECPDCGKKTLIPEGKCVTCTNCGWSKCG